MKVWVTIPEVRGMPFLGKTKVYTSEPPPAVMNDERLYIFDLETEEGLDNC